MLAFPCFFQLKTRDMVDVLHKDMQKLKQMVQPTMVSQQLAQLYKELDEKNEVR